MSRRGRTWWVFGATVLVVALIGGRWLAVETAERAWAASLTGGAGEVYLQGRNLARLFHLAVLLAAISWATANLYFVYRAIGSVQMPRRLGDLEIVEAVPQRILLGTTIASGLLFGFVMTWGTGDWWLTAVLASAPPRFGLLDPVLHKDLGYYAGSLPWSAALQDQALTAVASVTVVVALLYAGIGSLRWRGGRPSVSPRARGHLGLLLGGLGALFAWGALLDPAEVVAGWHGVVDHAALDYRIPGSAGVAGVAAAVAALSFAWGFVGRPRLLAVGWAALAGAALLVYVIVPATVRGASDTGRESIPAFADNGPALAAVAYGVRWEDPPHGGRPLPEFPTPAAALGALPLWDAQRVTAAAPGPVGGVTLMAAERPTWLVAPAPNETELETARPHPTWTEVHRGAWASTERAVVATESDTTVLFDAAAPDPRDSTLWYGRGFMQFAVAPAGGTVGGIPLAGGWRRTALAWVLQSPELARRETDGLELLWRRDVGERLARLAPFAAFESPKPMVVDGALWWLAYGYVSSDAFPLVPATRWRDRDVRYLRAGVIGAVRAATGETHLYYAPGADSLTAAWARLFSPLVQPAESLPGGIIRQLRVPRETFDVAVAALARDHGDTTTWSLRPRDPFEVTAGGTIWTAQGFEAGRPPLFAGLAAGTMTREGPELVFWRPPVGTALPPELSGANDTRPGLMRLWPAGGALLSLQALFLDRGAGARPRPFRAYLSWGDRRGDGPTTDAAWRDLIAAEPSDAGGPEAMAGDRWEEARRLLARADSALVAGDLERFGRLYAELKRKFGVGAGRRELAPAPRPN